MAQYGQYAGNTGGAGYDGNGSGIRLRAIPGAFLKQMLWAIPLIFILVGLSFYFTKDVKRQYMAEGRILVEYVYNPVSGSANFNSPLSITSDQVTLTEVGIIKNSAILDEVINTMISSKANGGVGGERFAPKLYNKWVTAPKNAKTDPWNDIVKMVDASYAVMPSPKSSIVDLSYKHQDPDVAVKTLNAFMASYSNFRKRKFVIQKSGNLSERRRDTEEQLASIEAKIQKLLNKNNISDFTAEQTGVRTRAELLRTQLNTLRGRLAASEAALAASEDQLRQLPPTIDLYIDDRGSQRLAQAELERRQLLAKYLPTSTVVRAKDAEIQQLRTQVNANGGKPSGGRRVGPNPNYQSGLTQRNTFQSTADSLREQEVTLQRQLNGAVAKVKRMREIGPSYANLVREKTTVETRLARLQARETEALVDEQQLENSSDHIKFITTPTMARKGRNMKKILRALAFLGATFSVFMLALLRVFLDPKLYGPGAQTRVRETTEPGTEPAYYNDIPESVPNYAPDIAPEPAYAPNHAPAAYGPDVYDGGGTGYAELAYEPPSPYGEPAPVEMEVPQIYADGSYGGGNGLDNPYASSPAHPYAPVGSPVGAPANHVGPSGNIPVLGTTDPKPYT